MWTKISFSLSHSLQSTEREVAHVKGHLHYSIVFRICLNPDLETSEEMAGGRPRGESAQCFWKYNFYTSLQFEILCIHES